MENEQPKSFAGGRDRMSEDERALWEKIVAACDKHTCHPTTKEELATRQEEIKTFGSCAVATLWFIVLTWKQGNKRWLPFVAQDDDFAPDHILHDHFMMVLRNNPGVVCDFTPAARDGGKGSYDGNVQYTLLQNILGESTFKERAEILGNRLNADMPVDEAIGIFKMAFDECLSKCRPEKAFKPLEPRTLDKK